MQAAGVVAAILLFAGCNSILGNETRSRPLSDSGSGGSGSGDASATGGAGGQGTAGHGGMGGSGGSGNGSGGAISGSGGSVSTGGNGGTGGATGTGGAGGASGSGGVDGGATLPPAVPRLIAPASLGIVTLQQPTLHWTLGNGSVGSVAVELCQDLACKNPLVGSPLTVANTATSAKVANALAAGVVYWRVSNTVGSTKATSATWHFWVPHRSANLGVDSVTGTVLDINGDGLVDFVIGSVGATVSAQSNTGLAHVYLNSSIGPQTFAIQSPDGSGTQFGELSMLGDVNGDGFGDFAAFSTSAAHIYFGSANPSPNDWNGTSAPRRLDISSFDGGGTKPSGLLGLGDVNGDGYADAAFPIAGGPIHILLGGPAPSSSVWSGPPSSSRVDIASPDGSSSSFLSVGDVNGDGYSDFLLGNLSMQHAYLFLGSAALDPAAWSSSMHPSRIDLVSPDTGASFFGTPGPAGDVNGDGYSDFLVGTQDANGRVGAAHLYLGGGTPTAANWNGASVANRIDLSGPDGPGSVFGGAVWAAGDVDGDGYGDFVVGAPLAASNLGLAHLYLGRSTPTASDWNGSSATRRIDLQSPDPAGLFGFVFGVGDTNGDTLSDFFVGAQAAGPGGSGDGSAHLYLGVSPPTASAWNGTGATKRTDIAGPDGAMAYFGTSYACLEGTRAVRSKLASRERSRRHHVGRAKWHEAEPGTQPFRGAL